MSTAQYNRENQMSLPPWSTELYMVFFLFNFLYQLPVIQFLAPSKSYCKCYKGPQMISFGYLVQTFFKWSLYLLYFTLLLW